MRTPSDSYIARYTDIERTYKMHNIGALPEFKMHNVRTVPTFKMHNIWTPMFYDICLELEFGLYSKKLPLIASVLYLCSIGLYSIRYELDG